MMRTGLSYKIIWLTAFSALLLTGCRSSPPPVEFYTLNAIRNAQTDTGQVAGMQPISIGVGPVAIPEVLDRPQLVIRTGPNTLRIEEFHRWAGRLDQDFARVLAENISLLLATEKVAVYPWDVSFKPQYQVTLDIRRFEGYWGQDVVLEVFWKVIDPRKGTTLRVKTSVISEPFTANDYKALVSTKSQTVAELSNKIASEIKNLNSNP